MSPLEIRQLINTRLSGKVEVMYREDDPLKDLDGKILSGIHAFCFYGDKLVIVYAENKGYWTPPGGGIEKGETYEQAIVREVAEETNMRVLHQELIGYQDVYEPGRIVRQVRSFCIVEPIGDFVADPDGDITEIKLVDFADYTNYVRWPGPIADRLLTRVSELKMKYSK
ncbi:MAG: hypothetical protein RLZZ347_756 [Candidatus Parcubacteria bacterium]|jgi:ADP-ribose pyrophosphatase YjhB (NUDIX family)